jgi:hypothetical protein
MATIDVTGSRPEREPAKPTWPPVVVCPPGPGGLLGIAWFIALGVVPMRRGSYARA